MLEDRPEGEAEQREEADPVNHPVIREEEPDPTISLAPGAKGELAPHVLRQWTVQIGPYNSCEVCLFGYHEDDTPELIAMDIDPEPEDYYDEEDEENE